MSSRLLSRAHSHELEVQSAVRWVKRNRSPPVVVVRVRRDLFPFRPREIVCDDPRVTRVFNVTTNDRGNPTQNLPAPPACSPSPCRPLAVPFAAASTRLATPACPGSATSARSQSGCQPRCCQQASLRQTPPSPPRRPSPTRRRRNEARGARRSARSTSRCPTAQPAAERSTQRRRRDPRTHCSGRELSCCNCQQKWGGACRGARRPAARQAAVPARSHLLAENRVRYEQGLPLTPLSCPALPLPSLTGRTRFAPPPAAA